MLYFNNIVGSINIDSTVIRALIYCNSYNYCIDIILELLSLDILELSLELHF